MRTTTVRTAFWILLGAAVLAACGTEDDRALIVDETGASDVVCDDDLAADVLDPETSVFADVVPAKAGLPTKARPPRPGVAADLAQGAIDTAADCTAFDEEGIVEDAFDDPGLREAT